MTRLGRILAMFAASVVLSHDQATGIVPEAVAQTDSLTVRVDSARHEVILTVQTFAPAHHSRAEHGHGHHSMSMFGWRSFDWPVDGWARGFRLQIQACGQALPRSEILHHLVIANLARRQVVHPAMERMLAVGSESPDVVLPKTVGVPLRAGTPLAISVGYAPPSKPECDLVFRLAILWSPKNLNPPPASVLPFYVDVAKEDVLAPNVFDLRPGRSIQTLDFEIPISGRLLAAGAHLHRYGQKVSLISLPTDTLSTLTASYGPAATVPRINRKLYGVAGRGLRLEAGRRYRLISEYLNPADSTLPSAGMAHFVGLFAPDAPPPPLAQQISNPITAEDYRRLCGRSYPACNGGPERADGQTAVRASGKR
jgi:hypothetical protein